MKLLLLTALLWSGTCNPVVANPPPGPIDIPDDGADAAAPVTDPATQCSVAWAMMADAECAPATGFDAWMKACANYPQTDIDCAMLAKSCAALRDCKGFQ